MGFINSRKPPLESIKHEIKFRAIIEDGCHMHLRIASKKVFAQYASANRFQKKFLPNLHLRIASKKSFCPICICESLPEKVFAQYASANDLYHNKPLKSNYKLK